MLQTLSFFPGQQATIFLEVKDGYGTRIDSPYTPTISKVLFPGLTLAANYPQEMSQIDVGLYCYQFILPTGASAVGSYLVEAEYVNPENNIVNYQLYQVIVSAPFGNFSASVGV